MSQHQDVSKDGPQSATIINGAAGDASETDGDGTSATARWRAVASKAGAKLTGLFDDAKAKAQESAADVSKKIAGGVEEGFDEAFEAIRAQAKEMMAKGKSTRVRIKLRERQLTEIPVAALAAAEAASFWWFGPIRMILGHIVGRAVLDFEFVSPADPYVTEARKCFLEGDIDLAMRAIDKAIEADHTCAAGHMLRGTLMKIRGDNEEAKKCFERAEECDSGGKTGARAKRAAEGLA